MLKELVQKYGKDKINTLTKYPSILTLHEIGEKGRLKDTVTTDILEERMYASEKIDGTNVRIVCYGDEFLIGSRKCILHYSKDLYWDESQGIVTLFFGLGIPTIQSDKLTIVFGELYGGKITTNSKNYGKDAHGFRVFDIATIEDLSILNSSLSEISAWRESTNGTSLRYGQSFYPVDALYSSRYELVPQIEFDIIDLSHQSILKSLKQSLPETKVALTLSGLGVPEGVVLRNANRTKIVKLRFEDYVRTLKNK